MPPPSNQPRKKKGRKPFYRRPGPWLFLLFLLLAGSVGGWIVAEKYTREYRERAATYDLEDINNLEIPSLIVDRNDREIGRIFVQNRSIVTMDKVPDIFVKALVAGEDSRFYSHGGVDYIGTVRALWLTSRGSSQGGSTLTQQLAREAYGLKAEALKRGENTIQRKLVEAFLAMRIEKRYKKSEILESYLNRVFFGGNFYGLRSASLGYFGKEPMDLSVEECASLVTLLKNPNGLSPLNNPSANRTWRDFVLRRMGKEGMLTKEEVARYQARPLVVNPKPLRRGTSHLYERVSDAVAKLLGEDALAAGGFKIHTTILAEAQQAAQKTLEQTLAKAEAHPGYTRRKYKDYDRDSGIPPDFLQGAVLMIDHENGEVLAHVGGRDYSEVQYDFIETGKRPLGTAFFPFLYAAGLSSGRTPATLVQDLELDNRMVMIGGTEGIPGEWGMEIPSPTYEGNITVRRAFEASKIAATVRFGNDIGLQKIVDAGVAFGFPMAKAELLPRLCVGWEQASMKQAVRAISTFARGGVTSPAELIYIDRIEAPGGKVIYRRTQGQPTTSKIIDDATAWQIHSMMAGSMATGSSAGALDGLIEKPFEGAGKGGTTSDFTDTWFLGYNKRVTCGVWTGFLQGAGGPIYPGAFSRDLAMPVWQAVMNAAAPSFSGGKFLPPASTVTVPICSISGQRATQFCQHAEEDLATGTIRSRSTAVNEYFRKGTENLPFCSVHSGVLGEGLSPENAIANLPALDAVPIHPQEPVLIGDDPYHSELPSFAPVSGSTGLFRRRTNVLDSLDIEGEVEGIHLKAPPRLIIVPD